MNERVLALWRWLQPRAESPGLLIVFGLLALHSAFHRSGIDFAVFYAAGGNALEHAPLYEDSRVVGEMIFKYAPAFAVFFIWTRLFAQKTAFWIWLALSVLALVRALRLSGRFVPSNARAFVHVIVLLLIIAYAQLLFGLGQIELVLMFVLVASEHWRKRAPVLSGALSAIPMLCKPPYALFAALPFCFRESKRALGVGLGALFLLCVPVVFYGVNGTVAQTSAWLTALAQSTPEILCRSANQSVFAMACFFDEAGSNAHLAAALALFVAFSSSCGVFVFLLRREQPAARELAWMYCWPASVILSPLGWRTNLVLLAPYLYRIFARLTLRNALVAASPLSVIAIINPELLGRNLCDVVLTYRPLGFAVWVSVLIAGGLFAKEHKRSYSQSC